MNIFIAHTPLQNFIAGTIAKQFFSNQKSKNILFSSIPNADLEYFEEYYYLEPNGYVSKIRATLRAKKKIIDLLKLSKCNLFIPHTGALLDNYFFYQFQNNKYQNKINFYYEGILYFYKYREPFKRKTHLKRKIFGFLSGMKYQYNEIIFPAMHCRVNTIYTILPKYTLGPTEKMKKVIIRQHTYQGDKNRILILGGKTIFIRSF